MHTISQALSPYLPREITDVIISFLYNSRTGIRGCYEPLRNCALVCRHWLPASRHHLLMDVWLLSGRQYNLFVSNVVRSPLASSWLQSTRRFSPYPGWTLTDGSGTKIASRFFMRQLGGRFPNLEQLHMFDLAWDTKKSYIPPRMFRFFSAFVSVRVLYLDTIRFPSFGTMRCTITA